jgi:hypothetical protein
MRYLDWTLHLALGAEAALSAGLRLLSSTKWGALRHALPSTIAGCLAVLDSDIRSMENPLLILRVKPVWPLE